MSSAISTSSRWVETVSYTHLDVYKRQCLSFYGLTDQLQVGTVSNMYDIVTRMQRAAKVVSL